MSCCPLERSYSPKWQCVSFGRCHAKTNLKIFVAGIPLEGLVWLAPTQPSLLLLSPVTTNIPWLLFIFHFIVVVIQKEGLAELMPTKSSFGMTTTKILWPIFVWHASNGSVSDLHNNVPDLQSTWIKHIQKNYWLFTCGNIGNFHGDCVGVEGVLIWWQYERVSFCMIYWLYQWIISFTSWTFYPFSILNVLFCLQVNSVGSFIRDLYRRKVLLDYGPHFGLWPVWSWP